MFLSNKRNILIRHKKHSSTIETFSAIKKHFVYSKKHSGSAKETLQQYRNILVAIETFCATKETLDVHLSFSYNTM